MLAQPKTVYQTRSSSLWTTSVRRIGVNSWHRSAALMPRRRRKSSLDDAAQAVGAEDRFEHARHVRAAAQPVPAVDVDDLPGDPARGVAEQEHRQVRDVGDLTEPGQ